MWLLYNLLLTILAPIWLPYAYLRSRKRKAPPNRSERMGDYPFHYEKGVRRIWVHAVSVGEVIAALPVLRQLRTLLPSHQIVLSVTTSSGHETASRLAEGLIDHLVYFPLDVARFQLAAMQRVRPDVVAIMETELWMNFLWAAKATRASTLLVNGRISDGSFKTGRLVRPFYRRLLRDVDRCLMQTEQDRVRILALGAATAEVFGNCKFDEALDGLDDQRNWREELGLDPERPVLVIGSTRGEEEELFVVAALEQLGEDRPQVVHAPRHLERVEGLAQMIQSAFGKVARRSKGENGPYLLLDTYGELAGVYGIADVVVVGGGFSDLGGQNLVQPLAHGKPVLHGPHMHNFKQVAEAAREAGATVVCATPEELAGGIRALLHDPGRRARMGAAARALVQAGAGSSRRYAEAIVAAANRTR